MRSYKSLAVALCAAVLSACAGNVPPYEALQDGARNSIASTEVVVPVKQSEIYVFVPDSKVAAAGGGGLLLALIDAGVNSVRTSKAENAVQPLRDAMIDYNFDQALQNGISTSLTRDAWLHAGAVRVTKDATPAGLDEDIASSSSDAVLLASADYRLSNNAEELTVTMTVGLYPRSGALTALKAQKNNSPSAVGNALYHETLMYSQTSPEMSSDRDQNIAAWSANHGAAMRGALNRASRELGAMLASDLNGGPGAYKGDEYGSVSRTSTGALNFIAR